MRNWIVEIAASAARLLLAAVLLCLLSPAVMAADAAPGPATAPAIAPQLTPGARQTLEQLACQGPHQQPLDTVVVHKIALRGRPHATLLEAEVRCHPHGEVQGLALRYLHLCDDSREHWTCSQAYEEYSTTINGREVLVSSAELAPPDMFAMAKTVGNAAVIAAPADVTAAPVEPAHCRITPRGGADPELYKMSCDVWELLVVRHCKGERCSYRAIDRGAPLFQ